MDLARKPVRTDHPQRRRPPAAMTRLVGALITAWALLVAALPATATVGAYAPVSTSIPIPAGYTEMLTPSHQGLLLSTWTYRPRRYPSTHHNMQFMAFRNPATSQILYVQTQDPDGQTIDWEVYHTGSTYALKLTIFSKDATFPSGFYITDTTMTATSQNEFLRKVAKKYKSWAINQKWAKRKTSPVDFMETMAITQDLRESMIDEQISSYINAWNGLPTACWITFWRKRWDYGIDGAWPDYRLGGIPQESRDSLAWLSNIKNCAPIGYTNALLWDSRVVHTPNPTTELQMKMNEVWENNSDARYSPAPTIKDEQGNVKAFINEKDGHIEDHMKYICQHQLLWEQTIIKAVRAMAEYGWKGIYYDMAAFNPPIPCYDESHGHELADPKIWQEGIRSILTALKTDEVTKHMMIFSEGNAEIYMDLIDGFIAYEQTAHPDEEYPLNKQVPLFREVYGEISRFVGWQLTPPGSPLEVPDITPSMMAGAVKKSANFGSLFNASPYFMERTVGIPLYSKIATDQDFSALFNLVNNPHYKKVYERGGGDINWLVQGTAPAPVNTVDDETGTAAVSFGMTDRDSGAYYELDINETAMSRLTWDMKMTGSYYIQVQVAASDGHWYNLLYDQQARNFRQTAGGTLKVGLGADTTDGQWRTFSRDLQDDLFQATGKDLIRVRKFRVFGQGLVDNIALSNTPYTYEDGTAATNWLAAGTGLTAVSATDGDTASTAVQFSGIADRDDGHYFARVFGNETQRFELAWDMKTAMPYYVLVTVVSDDNGYYDLLYDPSARDFRQTVASTVKIGLGTDTKDGQWRTFRRNLADDLYEGTGKNIARVVSMRVYATGSVDNVMLWGNGLRSSGR